MSTQNFVSNQLKDPRHESDPELLRKLAERNRHRRSHNVGFNDNDDDTSSPMPKPREDEDEDDDVDDDDDEDCFDPISGKQVIPKNMSPERHQQILDRGRRMLEELSRPHVDFHITPARKPRTAKDRRLASLLALSQARRDVAEALGRPCPIVHDDASGRPLPRDAIVTHSKPVEVVDEASGQKFLVAAPATGWTGSRDEIEVQRRRLLEENTRSHHAMSYRVLEEMRMKQLMRKLQLD